MRATETAMDTNEISLKKFGGTITVPDSAAGDFMNRWAELARKYEQQRLDDMTFLILGIRPER